LAHEAGFEIAVSQGEVVPYSTAAIQPVDAKLAWTEARAVLAYFEPPLDGSTWKVPPDWSHLLSNQIGSTAIPFCLGNYPQLVQDLGSLMQLGSLTAPQPPLVLSISSTLGAWLGKATWQGNVLNPLMSSAILRMAGHLDRCDELLNESKQDMPKHFTAAWSNELAALLWHRGHLDEAAALWNKQAASTPILFNRGLAALVAGKTKLARENLSQAIDNLPEDNAWHHLAGVYMALADMP
jgi:tetratricopeptide (TPR) repeat protein